MAIQMRRGNLVNYDEDKMLPGEFAVAIDEKELYIAFGTGDSKRVLTEDDISIQKIWTGTCASTASIAEKVVSLDNSTGFSLEDGVTIAVYFSAINNAQNPTLNVDNTGAKPIAYYYYDYNGGHTAGTEDPYYKWSNGLKVFTYKSNRWIMMTADTRWVSYLLENSRTALTATDQGSGVVTLSLT